MFNEVAHVRAWMDGLTFLDGVALGQVMPPPLSAIAVWTRGWRDRHRRHLPSLFPDHRRNVVVIFRSWMLTGAFTGWILMIRFDLELDTRTGYNISIQLSLSITQLL
jgi:hypothetical protein